jgi:hypothetical protein
MDAARKPTAERTRHLRAPSTSDDLQNLNIGEQALQDQLVRRGA